MANRAMRRARRKSVNGHDFALQMTRAGIASKTQKDIENQKALVRMQWLTIVTLNDAFGFGAERIRRYFEVLNENSRDLMKKRNDVVGVATEKRKAQQREDGDAMLMRRVSKIMGEEMWEMYPEDLRGEA